MTDYKYEKCVDCVHAHMDKDGNHDCGFEDCVSESDKRYSDDTPFESYCSCYDCFQKMVELEKENAELKSIADFQTSSNMDRFFQLKRSKERLVKAKEVIKGLLTFCRNYPQENAEKMYKAEQFLSEVKE